MASDEKGARRFVFHECLGSGSFGEVYRATLLAPGGVQRDVAVKMLKQGLDPRSQSLERLRDESQMLSLLNHPAILKIYDLAILEGRVCLVTEFIRGGDLSQCIHGGSIPLTAALEVVSQLASALHAAWNTILPDSDTPLQLVHRDIKPANIRLGLHGQVKLLDFGVAKSTQLQRQSKTATRGLVGTFSYMAPERLTKKGDPVPESDVYSIGCVLFEAIKGAAMMQRVGLRRQFLFAQDPGHHDLFVKRQIEGLDTPTSAKELLSEMLTHSPRTRIAPLLLSQQAEDLADTLKGPSLHTWCFARNWNEAPSEEGLMDGRTMDESFPFDAPLEDEETESIHEPNTERERLPGQDFIGRKREWAMLHALLNPGVTLLKGPGGIGKSRLALEVCQDGDRHRYVRAASARTKEELVWIVASELELTLRPGSTADHIQQVSARLAASPLTLLVLDNLEQLKPEAFEAIEMWTQACPQLCILATSRRGLPLDEVRVLTLDPFSSEEALALYIRRARERVPDYTPDSTEANDIQALGQAMGGLPLAIELAASRVRTVSPAQRIQAAIARGLPNESHAQFPPEQLHHCPPDRRLFPSEEDLIQRSLSQWTPQSI